MTSDGSIPVIPACQSGIRERGKRMKASHNTGKIHELDKPGYGLKIKFEGDQKKAAQRRL
jgi:hypothetical protein